MEALYSYINMHIQAVRLFINSHDDFMGIPFPIFVLALTAALATFIIKFFVLRAVIPRIQRNLENRGLNVLHSIAEEIKHPIRVFFKWSAAFAFLILVTMPISDRAGSFQIAIYKFSLKAFEIFIASLMFYALFRIVTPLYDLIRKHTHIFDSHKDSPFDFKRLWEGVLKVLIGTIAFVTIFEQLGFNAIGIIASLSILGAAGAFAAKDTVANIFGCFVVSLDRVVKKGDWIIYNGETACVEEMGLRSIRIRGRDDAIRIIPNGKFANSEILNWMTVRNQLIVFELRLTSVIDIDTVERIVNRIMKLLESREDITDNYNCFIADIKKGQPVIKAFVQYKDGNYFGSKKVRGQLLLESARIVKDEGAHIAIDEAIFYNEPCAAEAKSATKKKPATKKKSVGKKTKITKSKEV